MKKVVILLRGVSGSGKNFVVDFIKNLLPEPESMIVCSADDYFIHNGSYSFKQENLPKAHEACKCKFYDALEAGTSIIVINNTNTTEIDIKIYLDLARDFNYDIISLVVENRHNNTNIHNVPTAALIRQENNLRSSIKLN